MTFYPPDRPADPALFNEAVDAHIDYSEGLITEDDFLAILALYTRSERESYERAWRASFS
jgi:hypothetical protein